MNFNVFLCIVVFLSVGLIYFLKIYNKINIETRFNIFNANFVKNTQRFAIILSFITIIRIFIFEPFYIPSNSMLPTLSAGDFIFVDKNFYGVNFPISNIKILTNNTPSRGDIIVFKHFSGSNYVKRVVGLSGDIIQYKNNFIYVNGVPIKFYFCCYKEILEGKLKLYKEKTVDYIDYHIYKEDLHKTFVGNYVDIVVPQNCYFVLGDNRNNSSDSRYWGFVSDNDIVGKVSFIWMSIDMRNFTLRWSRIFSKL